MINQDFYGILSFLFIMVFFLTIGYSRKIFTLLCLFVILGYGLLAWQVVSFQFAESVIVIMGLIFFWFGLLSIRNMPQRSISLRLLVNSNSKESIEQIRKEIKCRIDDIIRHKLGVLQNSTISLTLFGKIIGSFLVIIFTVFRTKND